MTLDQVVRTSLGLAGDVVRRTPEAGRYLARMAVEATRRAEPPSAPIEVRRISDDTAFAGLKDEWDGLHRAAGARSPFNCFAWTYGWWMEIGRPRGHELFILTARRGERLIGLGAFYLAVERLGVRVLRNLGDALVGSEYLDVLMEPSLAPAVASAIIAAIGGASEIDAGELIDLDADSAFLREIQPHHPGLLALEHAVDERLPYLELGGSFAAYAQTLSSNMRYNLKRKDKKLDKAYPGAQLVEIRSEAELPDALEVLFRLHAKRWQSKGQSGNFPREVRAFHRRVAPDLLARGRLRLYQLRLDDSQIAATLYCLREGKRELYLQGGMDPATEDVSAGFCLMKRVIERCADEGLAEFDLLRGTEGYKSHWASVERSTSVLRFARPTTRGSLWAAGQKLGVELRALAGRHLPEDLLARLRAMRKPAAGAQDADASTSAR
ncbi:MAG: GNAT family N-acetyltransferase [Deltaproteobacteria bacterium]|nr:GNAT family N-acetyltransferase [Deltaproteobacteria bacterium]